MDGITKIYLVTNCYRDPNKIYIGKEKHPKITKREIVHKRTYGNQIQFDYIDQVESLDRKDWKPLEGFWIQYFIFLGFEVLNKQKSGGSGPEFLSEETKRRIGKANKGNKNLLGFKYNEEMLSKMRSPKTKEHREKIGVGNKGKIRNEQVLKNLRKPHKKGTGENISLARSKDPIICLETNKIFRNAEILSKEMGISATLVRKVCNGEIEKAKGFTLKYIKK